MMPIPSPESQESQKDYIQKCMRALKDEQKPQEQKLAICFSQWRNAKTKKKSKGSNEEPKWEDQTFDDGFILY